MHSGQEQVQAEIQRLLDALTDEGVRWVENDAGETWLEFDRSLEVLEVDPEALDDDLQVVMVEVAWENGTHEEVALIYLAELLSRVIPRSRHPAAERYQHWFTHDFLREHREQARDMLNNIALGLRDILTQDERSGGSGWTV
jgi:hypothetical protein